MRVDFGLQQSRANDEERRSRALRAVRGALVASLIAGAGLVAGLAIGLHDARWADAWISVADASSLFSAPEARTTF